MEFLPWDKLTSKKTDNLTKVTFLQTPKKKTGLSTQTQTDITDRFLECVRCKCVALKAGASRSLIGEENNKAVVVVVDVYDVPNAAGNHHSVRNLLLHSNQIDFLRP